MMEIKFNVTGKKRKELVSALGALTGCIPIYKKTPTFEFAVGNYIIDKNGTLKGDITQELLDGLAERGFADPESGAAFRISMPREECTEEIASEFAPAQDNECEDTAVTNRSITQSEPYTLVVEIPKDGFTNEAITNLEKLIASKAALIKKALGADNLTVEQTATTLKFPWFRLDTEAEAFSAYARFICALCDMAKEQKRITATEKEVANEKYAFRCFLLRLGFIGKDYKDARKMLLKNLDGNTAFRDGRPESNSPDLETELPTETGASIALVESPAYRKVMA